MHCGNEGDPHRCSDVEGRGPGTFGQGADLTLALLTEAARLRASMVLARAAVPITALAAVEW